MVKSYRRDTRYPNKQDEELLRIELEHLKPKAVVFMGTVARYGEKVADELWIPHHRLVHFGFFNYRRDKSVKELYDKWKEILESL